MNMIERAARALCEQDIRIKRRYDTEPHQLEKMMADAVDYNWCDYVPQVKTTLAAIKYDDWDEYALIGVSNKFQLDAVSLSEAWDGMIDAALAE